MWVAAVLLQNPAVMAAKGFADPRRSGARF
jgi:hypothetical protein